MPNAALQVFVFRDGDYVGSEIYPDRETVIGSGPQVDLQLADPAVANSHALMSFDGESVHLLDLETDSGTRINQSAITQASVSPRDEIQIGPFVLKIKIVESKQTRLRPLRSALPEASHEQAIASPSLGASLPPDSAFPEEATEAPTLLSADVLPAAGPSIQSLITSELDSVDAKPAPALRLASDLEAAFDLSEPAELVSQFSEIQPPGQVAPSEIDLSEPAELVSKFSEIQPPSQVAPSEIDLSEEPAELVSKFSEIQPRKAPQPPPIGRPSALGQLVHEALDDDEDDEIPPGFSLADRLFSAIDGQSKGDAIEVIALRNDQVEASRVLSRPGEKLRLGKRRLRDAMPDARHKGLCLVKLLKPGEAMLQFPKEASGFIENHRQKRDIDVFKTASQKADRKGRRYQSKLKRGDSAEVRLGDRRFAVRFVPTPIQYKEGLRFRVDPPVRRALIAALIAHLVLFLGIGIFSSGPSHFENRSNDPAHLASAQDKLRSVSARRLEIKGQVSREKIARVLDSQHSEILACYESALRTEPDLEGTLILEWVIQPQGRVGRIRQKSSTLPNPALGRCIMRKLKGWRFPAPRGGDAVVTAPFLFGVASD